MAKYIVRVKRVRTDYLDLMVSPEVDSITAAGAKALRVINELIPHDVVGVFDSAGDPDMSAVLCQRLDWS